MESFLNDYGLIWIGSDALKAVNIEIEQQKLVVNDKEKNPTIDVIVQSNNIDRL